MSALNANPHPLDKTPYPLHARRRILPTGDGSVSRRPFKEERRARAPLWLGEEAMDAHLESALDEEDHALHLLLVDS